MPTSARSRQLAAAIVFAVLFAAPLCAATPREQLLRYVPEKVGFCLVLNDLRGNSEALLASPFVEHFLQTPFGKALALTDEVKELAKFEKDLKELLGVDWTQLRDDILGDAVVLAYRPGPPNKPEQEQGLILVHARDPKRLAQMLDQLNAKQKVSGDLKELEEKQYKGATYFQRNEMKETTFYHLDGSLLLFTAQEEFLRQALDQATAAKKDAEAPAARCFRELGAEKELLSLWINPRAFDEALEANRTNKNKTDVEIAFATALTPYWKALDSIVVSVVLEKDLKVRLGFKTRMDDLPAAARSFLREASKPSEVWNAIPEDALFAVGGRLDLPALFELLGEFMTEPNRKAARNDLNRTVAPVLGKEDFFKDVLPYLGPDFGLYLSAPSTADKAWFPHTVLAMRVGNDGERRRFSRSVLLALHAYALGTVLAHNRANPQQQMFLKTSFQRNREITYLVNERGFPPGFRPALSLQKGYLFLASSPEVLGRFADAFKPGVAAKANDEVPLLRASLKDLRTWLNNREAVLTPVMAEQNKLTKEDAQQRMRNLLTGLEFVDRLEISQRPTPGQVVFTLTLQTARPLRK